jgi:hypothetical protein
MDGEIKGWWEGMVVFGNKPFGGPIGLSVK